MVFSAVSEFRCLHTGVAKLANGYAKPH